MEGKKGRGLQAFRRMKAWFTDHPEVIAASGSSAQALTNQVNALTGVITRMTEEATTQATQKEQATLAAKDEPALRSALHNRHLKAIVTVATSLRSEVPGIGVMRMPRGGISSEALVKAAEALSTTAAIYQDALIENGLPQDFLAQLDAATSALKASIDARGLALSKRTGATASVAHDFALGRRIVARIDASLLHALAADSPMLASWRQAKRITRKGVAPRVSDALAAGASTPHQTVPAPLVIVSAPVAAAPVTESTSTTASTPVPMAA